MKHKTWISLCFALLILSACIIQKRGHLMNNNETLESRRERLRQEELKNNPTGNATDAFNRANSGGLVDLVGSLGWRGTGILILVLIVGFIIFSVFFK